MSIRWPKLVFAGGCERIGQRRHLFVAARGPVGTAIEAEQELRLRDRYQACTAALAGAAAHANHDQAKEEIQAEEARKQ